MNLAEWLARQASIAPRRPALFLGRKCIADYHRFWKDSRSVAAWLIGQGVSPGDRIAIFMKNDPDYLTVFYGIWAVGAAVVPINAKLHGREAAYILEDSGASYVFASPDLSTALVEAGAKAMITTVPSPAFEKVRVCEPVLRPAARTSDDLAWLFYTSGTTGKPKGVMITHRMLMTMSLCYVADIQPVCSDDTVLYAAPMSHGAGIYNMLHVRAGARHVCPASGVFDPAEIFELAGYFGRTQLFAAPTMVTRMTAIAKNCGYRGEGLRTVIYAGGPMYSADIVEAVDHFGPIFVQIYGQGECPMGITALGRWEVSDREHRRWRERLQSVGRAQSAVMVAIGDETGHEVPVGSHGEIMVRGDTVMPGYWHNRDATSKTLLNGWLMTGDLGFMDEDGYVTLQDRSKDMIISGGSNIYPREVEEVLLTHPDVREVSVVGRPHSDWGEEVVAFVVGDFDASRLDSHCLKNIARFKRPKDYIQIDALPKNNYGKVLKTKLREKLSTK